jgi:hypothetical protein
MGKMLHKHLSIASCSATKVNDDEGQTKSHCLTEQRYAVWSQIYAIHMETINWDSRHWKLSFCSRVGKPVPGSIGSMVVAYILMIILTADWALLFIRLNDVGLFSLAHQSSLWGCCPGLSNLKLDEIEIEAVAIRPLWKRPTEALFSLSGRDLP